MKKYILFALTAVGITLVSCSQESQDKAKEYSKKVMDVVKNTGSNSDILNNEKAKAVDYGKALLEAAKSGDMGKVKEIASNITDYKKGLSEEDKQVFQKAVEKQMESHTDELIQAIEKKAQDPKVQQQVIETVKKIASEQIAKQNAKQTDSKQTETDKK